MADEREKRDELTPEELEGEHGEPLPDREVMSTVNPSGPPPFDPWDTLPADE
jgi:hypothetical protein